MLGAAGAATSGVTLGCLDFSKTPKPIAVRIKAHRIAMTMIRAFMGYSVTYAASCFSAYRTRYGVGRDVSSSTTYQPIARNVMPMALAVCGCVRTAGPGGWRK